MRSPSTTPTRAHGPTGRDSYLDAVKAIALWRVVVWHALVWPWLSWFAAMPAMFYVAGVLLQQSLDKRGAVATARGRIPRLLVPFWLFGLVAVTVMVGAGWRPGPGELVWWLVPLGDPVGLGSTPGLWVPLWYLRAYLWIVLGAALLSWLCRRFGLRALAIPAAATLLAWAVQSAGHDLPLPLADLALFPFFVMAGMLTATGALEPTPRRAVPVAAAAALLAVVWFQVDGAPMGIVNGSLPLHLLLGVATLAALTVVRGPLASPGERARAFVAWSSSRALTIYLWHGLGLVVADRTVHSWALPAPVAVGSGLAVVLLVTVAAACVVGPVEDRAAGRKARPAPVGARVALLPGVALTVAALLAADVGPDARMVPSGQVVMARAEQAEVVEGDLAELPARGSATSTLDDAVLQAVFAGWLDEHAGLLDELDTDLIEVALVDGDDQVVLLQWTRDGHEEQLEPFPWWSMSKTMTAAWMMQLADRGVIELDAPLIEHLADAPHGERMTFEQLAGHRAGLSSSLDGDILTATPIDELGAWFDNPELAYSPGEGYDYSRIGYHLLTWGLEEASGSSWRTAMEAIAVEAGVSLSIDEDFILSDRVTHPGDGDYRGALWGAGGLHGTTVDGARLFRWTLMEGLAEDSVRRMSISADGSLAVVVHVDLVVVELVVGCPPVSSANSNSSSAGLIPTHASAQVAVVGVEQAELADVGHQLGEEEARWKTPTGFTLVATEPPRSGTAPRRRRTTPMRSHTSGVAARSGCAPCSRRGTPGDPSARRR
jgi:CubicO group peptidase (beta-lactamase class C family)/peptidoglycan/LPS O-acetylase OafA/YrhL